MPCNGNFGIINEQGFVAGNGLGFDPVNEEDLNTTNEPKESDKKD